MDGLTESESDRPVAWVVGNLTMFGRRHFVPRNCSAMEWIPRRVMLLMMLVIGMSMSSKLHAQNYLGGFQNAAHDQHEDLVAGITQHIGAKVPLNLTFRNSRGKRVTLQRYFKPGRPVILDFIYFECPGVCPFVMDGVAKAMNKMPLVAGSDYDVVTISFDPHDTPKMAAEKKVEYGSMLHSATAIKHWHFLTGKEPAIQAMTSAVGFHYVWFKQLQRYDHPAAIFVLTPGGRVSQYLYGISYHPTTLKLSLVQAGDHTLGTAFDQVLLLCCSFNPVTGRYAAIAVRVMTLSGVLVVVALGTMFGFVFYWDKKRRGKNSSSGAST